MKKLLPHSTKNTALAVVAFLFRIPVNRRRVYSEDFLKRIGLNATQAYKGNQLGEVEYAIETEDQPLASVIITAFNDEKDRIEGGQFDSPLEIDPEVAARFAARVLYARKNFMTDLFKLIPFVRIKHIGSPQRSNKASDGSYTVKVPGHIDVRIDASEETKKHLGLI
jgi:hypothetical protein